MQKVVNTTLYHVALRDDLYADNFPKNPKNQRHENGEKKYQTINSVFVVHLI